ncbi:MAG TPA: pyridoxamine 5'-phosphate oxidase [Thermomicrobiales bacterium]|nr:pyridoxamine 5'-phosphate oxidase [Thermomicrobiales bacterium]
MNDAIAAMRQSYERAELGDRAVDTDPFVQFGHWFEDARASSAIEANAMIVSTVDANGRPSARTVLLKGFDPDGFVFYTNYESRKGRELAANPHVALTFYWAALERQVRIEGRAEQVSPELSDAYFASRPPGSQVGSIASPQSAEIPDRAWLEARVASIAREVDAGASLERPSTWGGYRVVPSAIEFWQGRPDRLHDRIRFDRQEDGTWTHVRLAP